MAGDDKSNMTARAAWPRVALTGIPSPTSVQRLAGQVRRAAVAGGESPRLGDLHALCRTGRFRVIERQMGGHSGGSEAVLLPQPGNRFHIWVDPAPRGGWDRIAPSLRNDLRRHRLRFRVAHEIGHSLFYRRSGGEPCRILGDSAEQERFADDFARALLVPAGLASGVPPTPGGVLGLQVRCDVSLEVAVRGFAAVRSRASVLLAYWAPTQELAPNSAVVQWASADLALEGNHALGGRLKAIVEATQHLPRGCRTARCLGGSAAVLRRRRQLLWIRLDPPPCGLSQP